MSFLLQKWAFLAVDEKNLLFFQFYYQHFDIVNRSKK